MPSCLGSVSTMNFKPVGIQKSKNQRSAPKKRYEALLYALSHKDWELPNS